MDELGSPGDWKLKGEGNANLVFAYTGSDPCLVGRVLRVRKPRAAPAPEQAALEDAVWAPVLGPLPPVHFNGEEARSSASHSVQQPAADGAEGLTAAADAAAQREQRYVERMLTPLLGRQHIPSQQPVRPSPAFVQHLLSSCGVCASRGTQAAADAAGTAALLPDVTLLPPCGAAATGWAPQAQQNATQQQQQQQQQQVVQMAQQQAAQAQQQQQQQQQQQLVGQPVGPVVCLELKPKCGFVASCGTVHPSNRGLKHSRSRYQLHQLLKLSQGKIDACSAYEPCDLFSGDPARLRAALAAMLEQPQNNLLLFVDGQRQQLAGQQRRKGRQGQQQQEQEQAQEQQAQQQQQQAQATPPLEQLLGGLLPLPPQHRRATLAELLAAVLERESVLPRLLQAQRQCPYDVEGIYRLYCQLAGLQPEETAAGAADNNGNSGSGSGGGGSSGTGTGSGEGNGREDTDCSGAHVAAVAQLLALPAAEAHAVLRAYVVSATAKDCAVMVALQRLDGPPAAAAGQNCLARAAAGVPAAGMTVGSEAASHGEAAAVQQALSEQQQWWNTPPGCFFLPGLGGEQQLGGDGREQGADASAGGWSGAWFRYRLCFVDLDLKPLAKIPTHAELDRRIVAAAQRHLRAAGGAGGAP